MTLLEFVDRHIGFSFGVCILVALVAIAWAASAQTPPRAP